MREQPFSWEAEMWIGVAALMIAAFALYAIWLHRPA
jgi:hypothetical protein